MRAGSMSSAISARSRMAEAPSRRRANASVDAAAAAFDDTISPVNAGMGRPHSTEELSLRLQNTQSSLKQSLVVQCVRYPRNTNEAVRVDERRGGRVASCTGGTRRG